LAEPVAGLIVRWSESRRRLRGEWLQIFTLSVALTAWAAAGVLGGSGFIAAFMGGLAFGQTSRQLGPRVTYLTEKAGGLLAGLTPAIGDMGSGHAVSRTMHLNPRWQVVVSMVCGSRAAGR
jgi:hypothetical protein